MGLIASCSGGDPAADVTTVLTQASVAADPTTTAVAETTTTVAPVVTEPVDDGIVSSVDEVKAATVQILAQGSYRDPAEGQISTFGSGSGFIIDPTGIIVTNNHVVTGAGAITVVVGGGDEEIPAKVLGVSECNDLAVLQLADPADYPYFEWFEGDVSPPMEIFSAGFPLGDPEFTMTKGIVSKAEADGDTNWASVRSVIEHDANIQPGNSGGPLITADGALVGVNYAGGDPGTGTSQYFAISREIAEPLVEELRKGDLETIGVNGTAFVDVELGLSGVWVGAVAAGSPASKVGLQPGDVITALNGVNLSSGTMKEYCDVLRTADVGGAIAIDVIRFDTQVGLTGELNVDGKELAESFSFADEVTSGEVAEGVAYEYMSLTDDTGRLTVEVPTTWTDYTTDPLDTGFGTVPGISASPDWDDPLTPGMLMYLFDGVNANTPPDAFLDTFTADGCVEQERNDYADAISTGRFNWLLCDDDSVIFNVVAESLSTPGSVVVLRMLAWTEADLEAVDKMIATFIIG